MKGKRYSTEDQMRVVREAETVDKSIVEVCKEKGMSEQTFHRWKREFGMLPVDQAKRPNAWLGCLKAALRRVSRENPEMGYPKIARLLKEEGWPVFLFFR